MDKPTLFQMVDLPYCQVLMLEHWDAAPGRFFVAYRASGNFRHLLGQGVVDEFRTISAPVLLSPASTMGGIYDAGMRLADARDIEAPIDQGWPPLTIGIDTKAPDRPDDWMDRLLQALKTQDSEGSAPWSNKYSSVHTDQYQIETVHCNSNEGTQVCISVTDAPLLPMQLERLAEIGDASISVAISIGNRLPRVSGDELQQVDVVSETQLDALLRLLKSA